MAIIKPEQLSSGTYNISGSFSGSFHGDGSDLTNLPQEILKYSSSINFPQPSGSINYLYLDQSANNLYSWDTTVSQYVLLNSSTVPPPTGSPEGTLYFADLATSARLATCTYDNGISGSGATLTSTGSIALGQFNQPGKIDNITPLASDIILVKNETPSLRNGLYSITNPGSPTSSFVLTRVSYYDTGSEIYPSQITVLRGTTAANQTYIQQTDNPTVGSSSIVFSQSPSTATQTLPILFMDTVTTGPLPSSSYATGSSYTGFPGYQATITSTTTGSLGVIGGITASSNIRILVVSESNSVYNGSYTVTSPGSSTTPWRLTRIDYWTSMQPQFKEFVISRYGAIEYGSRYVLQSSSITNTNIGISQSLIFQKYLSPSSGSGGSTPAFPFTGSATITGSLTVTGSVSSTQGFTGSLLGTASLASTASYVITAQTASYVLNAVSSSFATTASYALNALSASYAPSVSPFPFTGSALITGSLGVTGSVSILAFTSSAANIFSIRNSTNTQNLMSLSGDGRIAIGLGAQILGNTSFANRNVVIGNGACDIPSAGTSENSIAIGYNASSSNSGTAIGANTVAASRQGTAIGQGAYAGEDSIALGYGAKADGSALYTSLAIGRGARASATLSGIIAVGQASYTNALQQTLAFCVDPVGANSQTMLLTNNANLIFRNSSQLTSGTHWDTTATNTLTIHTGSIPASNILNAFQLYSSASIVGNAVPHFRTGAGNIVKLYTQAAVTSSQGIADALTNLGLLTGSSVIVTTPTSGPFGISNSSGSYTYYNTLSASMAAATSGQTVEVFADITESSAVTITCKDNVKINGNGHTYKCTSNGVNLRLFTNVSNGECYINNLTIEHTSSHSNSATIYLSNGSFDLTGTIIKKDSGFGAQVQGGKLYNGIYIGTGTTSGVINQGGEIFRCTSYCVNGKAINNNSGNAYSVIGVTTGTENGIEGVNIYKGTGIAYGNAYGAYLNGNCHNVEGFSSAGVGVYLHSGNYSNITGISNGSFGVQNQGNNCLVNNLRAISTVSNGFFTQFVTGVLINGGFIQSSEAVAISSNSGLILNSVFIKNTWNNAGGHGLIVEVDTVEVYNCIFDLINTSANCLTALTAKNIKYANNAFKGATVAVTPNITQGMINTHDNQGNIII